VGSGTNYLTDLRVGGSSKFNVTNAGNVSVSGNIYTQGALSLDGVDGLRLNQGAASTFSPTPGIFYSGTSGQGWYFQVPNNGQEKFSFKLGSTDVNREFRVVDPSWNPLFQVQGTGDAIIANNLTVGGTITATGSAQIQGLGTTSATTAFRVENSNGNDNFIVRDDGNVGIGTTSPDASAILEVTSTTKGVLFPRMSETEKDAISSPATGLIVYQTDAAEGLWIYKSTGWVRII